MRHLCRQCTRLYGMLQTPTQSIGSQCGRAYLSGNGVCPPRRLCILRPQDERRVLSVGTSAHKHHSRRCHYHGVHLSDLSTRRRLFRRHCYARRRPGLRARLPHTCILHSPTSVQWPIGQSNDRPGLADVVCWGTSACNETSLAWIMRCSRHH
jgi:hypothetical protein